MNEEIEYAEMLEIPVSTVNVVKKRTRKQKKSADLKEKVISKVNETAETEGTGELLAAEETATEETGEVLPIPIPRTRKKPLFARLFQREEKSWEYAEEAVAEPTVERSARSNGQSLALGIEFAVACALCLGIFLTNFFMPHSAINVFFRSLTERETVDSRTYADFALANVVYDESVALTVSETGVLSFTDDCCVYPSVEGTVMGVLQESDGSFTVKIAHTPTFSAVITGLTYAPVEVGGKVKTNVPIGYSNGEREVQVTMYEAGELLNCFYVTEENCLAWVTVEE